MAAGFSSPLNPKPTKTVGALALQAKAETVAARLPALLLEAEKIAGSLMLGLHGRYRAGPGETFWQYRPYDTSDDRKMIDWRQSARSPSRLYIRQTEWESADTVWIWTQSGEGFDFHQSTDNPTKQSRAELIASALAILLNRAGERVGLLDSNNSGKPMSGRDAPQRFVQRLLERSTSNVDIPPLPEKTRQAHGVFLGDFYQPLQPLADFIRTGSAEGLKGHLVQICDPSEEDFPFAGRLSFFNMKDQDSILFGDAASIRAAYKKRFDAHRQTLAEICRRHGWTFSTHRTSNTALSALLSLHTLLARDD